LTEGEALIVAAVLQLPDGWSFGALRIAMREDQPFVWIPRRGKGARPIPPPIDVREVRVARGEEQRHMKALHFRVLVFDAAKRSWKMAVPTIDVPLVRDAFGRTSPMSTQDNY